MPAVFLGSPFIYSVGHVRDLLLRAKHLFEGHKSRSGGIAKAQAAADFAERVRPVFAELADLSARGAAQELNRRNIPTAAGGLWHAVQVVRVRERLRAWAR